MSEITEDAHASISDLRMHAEPKAVWCELLKDPTLLQVTGKLYGTHHASQYGYCCLGVFARSQGAEFQFETVTETAEDNSTFEVEADEATVTLAGDHRDLNDDELLEQDWADQHGLTAAHQRFLSHLNDGGECTVAKSDAMFPLYVKYAETESAPRLSDSTTQRMFKFRKHSFSEIRDVILVEF